MTAFRFGRHDVDRPRRRHDHRATSRSTPARATRRALSLRRSARRSDRFSTHRRGAQTSPSGTTSRPRRASASSSASATGDSFAWPSFLAIKTDAIGVRWTTSGTPRTSSSRCRPASRASRRHRPGSAARSSVIKIQPSLLAQGKFPVIDIQSIGVTVKGDVRRRARRRPRRRHPQARLGTTSSARSTPRRRCSRRVLARHPRRLLDGRHGGLHHQRGALRARPLQAFINVQTPTGILIVPQIGLTINDFSAGVEFFKSLPRSTTRCSCAPQPACRRSDRRFSGRLTAVRRTGAEDRRHPSWRTGGLRPR